MTNQNCRKTYEFTFSSKWNRAAVRSLKFGSRTIGSFRMYEWMNLSDKLGDACEYGLKTHTHTHICPMAAKMSKNVVKKLLHVVPCGKWVKTHLHWRISRGLCISLQIIIIKIFLCSKPEWSTCMKFASEIVDGAANVHVFCVLFWTSQVYYRRKASRKKIICDEYDSKWTQNGNDPCGAIIESNLTLSVWNWYGKWMKGNEKQ